MSIYCIVKNQLKEDFWKIINKKEVEIPNFEFLILNEFLNLKVVDLRIIVMLARRLREEYKKTIQDVYDYLERGCTDVLFMIKELKEDLKKRILPILNKVESIKNGRND